MCFPHKICAAGQFTKTVGTVTKDTECVNCDAGTWRAVDPKTSKPSEMKDAVCKAHKNCGPGQRIRTAGSLTKDTECASCTGASEYSDESGLKKCKTCSVGYFGVVVKGSTAEGGHTACDDDACERPTNLPANSMFVPSKCPDHGKHTGKVADSCTLSCKGGFFSIASSTPYKCAPDSDATTASYQGGAITCKGECISWVEGRYGYSVLIIYFPSP